jgi:hypothetical protein
VIPVVDPRGFLTADEFRQIEGVPQVVDDAHQPEGAASR